MLKKLSDLVETHLDNLRLARRVSPRTERLYAHYLTAFLEFRLERGAGALEISPQEVNDFLAWLDRRGRRRRGRPLSAWALDKAFDVLRGFCRWACDNGELQGNPFRLLKPPLIPDRPRAIASRETILRLLELIARAPRRVPVVFDGTLNARRGGRRLQPNPAGRRERALCLRDAAFFAGCYFAGLRVSECAELPLEQLHLDDGYLNVVGKGGRARAIPIHPILKKYLQTWLRARAHVLAQAGVDNHFVFITMPGRGVHAGFGRGHVSAFRMEHLLAWRYVPMMRRARGARAGAGLPDRFTPHSFRHSVATRMLDRHVELSFVQEFLGHRDPRTTRIYARVKARHLKDAVARA